MLREASWRRLEGQTEVSQLGKKEQLLKFFFLQAINSSIQTGLIKKREYIGACAYWLQTQLCPESSANCICNDPVFKYILKYQKPGLQCMNLGVGRHNSTHNTLPSCLSSPISCWQLPLAGPKQRVNVTPSLRDIFPCGLLAVCHLGTTSSCMS